MLKLTYTEFGLHLEVLATPLDVVVSQRAVLAMRLGQSLHIQAGRAAFLLPATAPELVELDQMLKAEMGEAIELIPVDDAFVEVSVQGSWIAESSEAYEGTFLTVFPNRIEFLIHQLWQASQVHVSSFV